MMFQPNCGDVRWHKTQMVFFKCRMWPSFYCKHVTLYPKKIDPSKSMFPSMFLCRPFIEWSLELLSPVFLVLSSPRDHRPTWASDTADVSEMRLTAYGMYKNPATLPIIELVKDFRTSNSMPEIVGNSWSTPTWWVYALQSPRIPTIGLIANLRGPSSK